MFRNACLDSFGVGTIYYIDLFSLLEIVERRHRSYTLSFHQFGCLGGSISNDLKKNSIRILVTEIAELWSNYFTRSAPVTSQYGSKKIYRRKTRLESFSSAVTHTNPSSSGSHHAVFCDQEILKKVSINESNHRPPNLTMLCCNLQSQEIHRNS